MKSIASININGWLYNSTSIKSCFSGTPPFSVTWLKDGREIPDNDYHKYVIYGDGGVALRLSNVCPQDAGEYTCLVRNNFGEVSSNGLFAVQGTFLSIKFIFRKMLTFHTYRQDILRLCREFLSKFIFLKRYLKK